MPSEEMLDPGLDLHEKPIFSIPRECYGSLYVHVCWNLESSSFMGEPNFTFKTVVEAWVYLEADAEAQPGYGNTALFWHFGKRNLPRVVL